MFSKMLAVGLAAAVAVSSATPVSRTNSNGVETFATWSTRFNQQYASTDEETMRSKVYAANVQFIDAHNKREAAGLETYRMATNLFSGLTVDEWRAQYVNSKFNRTTPRNEVFLPAAPADEVDWRTKGAVTPVKNQGQCGSCWSFSTTGSTEGAWQIATGKLVSLSEQQLMDCSTAEGDHSCQGGLMDYGFEYIVKNGGIDTEADYPYKMANEACNSAKEKTIAAMIASHVDVPQNSDAQMAAAIAKGPVSIAIEADQAGFQHYSSGVFSGPCGTKLDHGVLAVGYSETAYIVKNSWGPSWGDAGYIQLARGGAVAAAGTCGMLMQPSYPIAKAGPVPPGPTPPGPPGPAPGPPSPASCASISPGNRSDCGFTLSKDECGQKGCCYDDSNPRTFKCFYPDQCSSINPADRVDCGFTNTEAQCLAAGCCYDKSVPFTYACFCKNAAPPTPPGPTPPGPTPPGPTPPGPTPPGPAGGHYGDPNKGPCLADEKAVQINGITGKFCSPSCSSSSPCPPVPAGTTATPQCVVQDPSPPPTQCAVICVPGLEHMLKVGDGGCMPGADCQAIQGTGVCTYADSNAQTFAFNLGLSIAHADV